MKSIKHILAVCILLAFSQSSLAQQFKCKTDRKIFFDNANTKVWASTICPHQALAYHTHQYPRVAIAAEDGVLNVLYRDGTTSRIEFTAGEPVFLSLRQGQKPHQDINDGIAPMHITVIEIK